MKILVVILAALLLFNVPLKSLANENIKLVVTNENNVRKIISVSNAEVEKFKSKNTSYIIEDDLFVSSPKIKPKAYNSDGKIISRYDKLVLGKSSQSSTDTDYTPNDEYFSEQVHWLKQDSPYLGYNNVLFSVRALSPLRRPVVGVIDSGFYQHPDLTYLDGYNMSRVEYEADGQTYGGERGEYFYIPEGLNNSPEGRQKCTVHGTGVAGVAVATRDNNIGFAGITDADFIATRSMACGGGFLSDSADAIRWQLGEQVDEIRKPLATVDVINLSLGGQAQTCPSYLQEAITQANVKGVPVVVAIGNNQIDASEFTPTNCNGVINVAAATREGDLFPTSNFGKEIDIVVLGEYIAGMTAYPEQIGYWEESSFATPIVTGVIANAVAEFGPLTPAEIKFFLAATATSFAPGQCDDSVRCGPGILDAEQFHLAMRAYKTGGILSIKPALSNSQFCDNTLYITDDNELQRLCSTLEVSLPIHQSNRSDIRFDILQYPKGQAMTFENGAVVMTTQSSRLLVANLDLEQNDYGVRVCNNERCFGGTAIKISNLTQDKPEICE
ncbi:S8 family serine peptidase [Paraglaciecola sp.]|uniref:S8 family peptidase n=1 Tax=Paraglaciecola sp. TaxID=1920173 RepID=UPI00273EA295|nr:S8 family serine peptidase [Paraglaciecola sp.]MDP5031412.1 S8 family serine peptidase [Paraglaciecola sp.]